MPEVGGRWRSDRSLDAEMKALALADAEKTRVTRLKATDYILDRFNRGDLDIDSMTEVLVVSGMIENE